MRLFMRSITIFIMLLSFFACKDDNMRESKVAPVSNVTYSSANGAILFRWDNPNIENLAYVEISYVDKVGKVHRCLTQGKLSEQWIEGIADNSLYYFRFLVYNIEGEVSEPVEVMAAALESTVNLFYGRVKLGVDFSGINVTWENNYDENFYVELAYTDLNGNSYKEEVVVGPYTSGKQFVKIGASLMGSQSLDVFATIVDANGNESDRKVLKFFKKEAGKLDRSKWKVASYSSQEDSDGTAANMLDGNSETIWHTRWRSNKAQYPHWVVLDLGTKKHVEKVGLQQRQSSSMIKGVSLYGNNVTSTPADESMWTLCYEFDVADVKAEQIFELPDAAEFRYFKLIFTSPAGVGADNACASVAELNFYGSDVADQ